MLSISRSATYLLIFSSAGVISEDASSHHSRAHFDNEIVEMPAEILEVRWQNPHVEFLVRATDAAGETADWELESGSIYMLNRFENVGQNAFKIGDRVRIAGQVSRRTDNLMLVTNILLSDGAEAVMMPNRPNRWVDENGEQRREVLLTTNVERSLFHVWSASANRNPSDRGDGTGGGAIAALRIPPLTPAGKAAMESVDIDRDEVDPEADCARPGLPPAMFTPHPMQFVDNGDHVSMRIQENDIERIIWIGENAVAAAAPRSPLGYSVGHWEDTTLVVHTTNISWPFYNNAGVPLSSEVYIDERYEISADGSRLTILMVTTDPINFVSPVSEQRDYVLLGEEMHPFDCVPGAR